MWKGITGRSIIFSLLFATAVLGYSGSGFISGAFKWIGVPWWLAWLIPLFLIGAVAKREDQWLPNEKFRRWLSLGIVIFSALFGFLLWQMEQDAKQYDPPKEKPRRTGPPGKH